MTGRRAAGLIWSVAALLLIVACAAGAGVAGARAASPSPAPAASAAASSSPGADPGTGDVRTNPAAPGLVGDPLFAVGGVIVIAAVTAGATLLAIRLDRTRS